MKRLKRVRRSRTIYQRLVAVFSRSRPEMNAQLIRLCVLYEDLKIEAVGSTRKHTLFDYAGRDYRRFYFIRGALHTFREVNSVLVALDACPDFHRVRGRMPAAQKAEWDAAVKFFRREAAEFNKVRNTIGAHFSQRTGEYVLSQLDPDRTGRVEIKAHASGRGAGVTFHFAFDFVAIALTREHGEQDWKDYTTVLLEAIKDGYGHVAKAVHAITVSHLIPEFEGGR